MDVLDLYRQVSSAEPHRASNRDGGEFYGPCPACGGDSKSDRFRMWPHRTGRVYWCRQPGGGCGKSGDLLQFRIDFMGEDFKAAAAACGKELSPPKSRLRAPSERRRPVGTPVCFQPQAYGIPDPAWVEKATALVGWAKDRLVSPEGDQVRAWLARRGIDSAAIDAFSLGWIPGENGKDLWRPRKSWGLPEEKVEGRVKALWIPRGIVIPLVIDGACWRIRIRRDQDTGPRYYMLPGSSNRQLVTDGDPRAAVVVESELDAISLAAAIRGAASAVALGSVSIRPDLQAHKLLIGCLRILVALDADEAGAKSWPWWRDIYGTARRYPVPAGKDPGDAVAAGVDLAAWVWSGLPPALTIGPSILPCNDERRPRKNPPRGSAGVGAEGGAASGRQPGVRGAEDGEACAAGPAGPVPVGEVLPVVTGVLSLAHLMAGAPVRIRVTSIEISTLRPDGWAQKNWLRACQISELVFFDKAVREYLCGLPAGDYAATDLVRLQRSGGGGHEAVLRPGRGAQRAEGGA